MDKIELLERLNEIGISEQAYSLEGGTPPERMVVEKGDMVWEVYYSERGAKVDSRTFLSADEAYSHLYSVFKSWKDKGSI